MADFGHEESSNCSGSLNFDWTPFLERTTYTTIGISSLGAVISTATAIAFACKAEKTLSHRIAFYLCTTDLLCNLASLTNGLMKVVPIASCDCVWCCWLVTYPWFWLPTTNWLLVLTLALIRFLAVCRPLTYRLWMSSAVLRAAVAVCFALGALLTFPFIVTCDPENPIVNNWYIDVRGHNGPLKWYILAFRVVFGAVIAVTVIYLYARIVYSLHVIHRDSPRSSGTPSEMIGSHVMSTFSLRTNNMEVMFINVTFFFLLFNGPYALVETLDMLIPRYDVNPHGTGITLIMFNMGFVMNPFVFYNNNQWFRSKVNALFCCLCRRRRNSRSADISREARNGTEMVTSGTKLATDAHNARSYSSI